MIRISLILILLGLIAATQYNIKEQFKYCTPDDYSPLLINNEKDCRDFVHKTNVFKQQELAVFQKQMYQIDGVGYACNVVKNNTFSAFKIGPNNMLNVFPTSVYLTPEQCKDIIFGDRQMCFKQELIPKENIVIILFVS